VQVRVIRAEEAPVVVEALADEQAVDDVQRLVHALHLLGHVRPVHPGRRLVQRLARPDPQERAPRVHLLERRERLRDDRRVVAVHRRGDAGAERDPLGRAAHPAEQDPGLTGLARLPPRLEVVADGQRVEAGALGLHRLAHQVAGRELLAGELGPVAHGLRLPARTPPKSPAGAPPPP